MTLRDTTITLAARGLRALLPQRPAPQPFQPRSLVVVRSCCLGDVLLASAVVAALRAALPQTHLAFAVHSFARAAIAGNPKVDEVIDCGDIGVPRFARRDYLAFVRILRARRFEAAVVLDPSPLVAATPWLAGIPVRAGLDSQGRGFALNVRVPLDPLAHRGGQMLDVVRAIGLPVGEVGPEFTPSDADRAWAAGQLRGQSFRQAQSERWAALHPGGGVNPGTVLLRKRWPAEGFAALARRLLDSGWRVVLIGDAGDRDSSAQVRALLGDPERVLDLTGTTTWGQLGAMIERCGLFVGNDSGPLHLATAVGTPVVGLYGPTTPAIDGPLGPTPRAVVYHGLDCSPCFVGGRFRPTRWQADCMLGITMDEVWNAVERLMQAPIAR